MESNTNESVTQSEQSGALPEENLSKPQVDYRKDMLRYKDEVADLREKLKEIELGEQQKKGDLEGVIASLKDEIKQTKAAHAQDRYEFANTKINDALRDEAESRGLSRKQAEVLMQLVEKDDKGRIELGKGFSANGEDVKSVVDKNMERYAEVFKKSIKVADASPSAKAVSNSNKTVDTSKMSAAELKEYILANKDKLK